MSAAGISNQSTKFLETNSIASKHTPNNNFN